MTGEEVMVMSDYAILQDGQVFPVSLMEWAEWHEGGIDQRRVALDQIAPEVRISTVFLGLNHGFGGQPQWFETLVFGGPLADEMDRYATFEEAIAGHSRMVERCRAVIREQMEASCPS